MKKVLLLVGMVFALCSCGEKQPTVDVEKEIEKTVTQNLRKRMKNPDSFVLESIEIEKDTVPYYLQVGTGKNYLQYGKDGKLKIAGHIEATSGNIAGWNIEAD